MLDGPKLLGSWALECCGNGHTQPIEVARVSVCGVDNFGQLERGRLRSQLREEVGQPDGELVLGQDLGHEVRFAQTGGD